MCVHFEGYVERDSWYRRFVASRTHERHEPRAGPSHVPKRGQERSCEEGGEYRVALELKEAFFSLFVEPWKYTSLSASPETE